MPIARADLKMYKSAAVNDTGANGGRMSASQVASAAIANLFASVDRSERLAGSTKYRKAFWKVANDGAPVFYNAQAYMHSPTPGDDAITFFPATQTDTQAAITGSERRYGVGSLDASIAADVAEIDVAVEDGNTGIFQIGDTVRVTDRATLDGAGNEEFRQVDDKSVLGNIVTLTLTEALENAYLASVTRVSSVYVCGDVKATVTDFVVTTAGDGDYDSDFLTLNNIGAIEQTWTLTWTGAGAFDAVGDTVGAVGSGSNGAGASPNNPSFTKPYFILASGGFSGTYASGDTIVFKTHPAAPPFWYRRVVPVDADVLGDNKAVMRFRGERA